MASYLNAEKYEIHQEEVSVYISNSNRPIRHWLQSIRGQEIHRLRSHGQELYMGKTDGSEKSSQFAEVVENENASSVALGNEQLASTVVDVEATRVGHRFIERQRQHSRPAQSRVHRHHGVVQPVRHQYAPAHSVTSGQSNLTKGRIAAAHRR